MWKWCWAWSEGNPAPHFHDVSKWLESLITGSLHQQWHREVSGLEPLCHLLITERTWNHINQHTWGRGSKAGLSMLETRSWLRSHSALHQAFLPASPTQGTLLIQSWSVQAHLHKVTALPWSLTKSAWRLSPRLGGRQVSFGVKATTLVQVIPLLSSSSTYCFRLPAAAASTLELSSTCWLTRLKHKWCFPNCTAQTIKQPQPASTLAFKPEEHSCCTQVLLLELSR